MQSRNRKHARIQSEQCVGAKSCKYRMVQKIQKKTSDLGLSQLLAFSNTIRQNSQRGSLVKVGYFWGKATSLRVPDPRLETRSCLILQLKPQLPPSKKFFFKSNHLRYLLAIVPDHHTISVKYEVPGRRNIGRCIRKIWNCIIRTTK